jgi:4-amino-4-deoxy-L-arabinose transferase-like glycosyltransferase
VKPTSRSDYPSAVPHSFDRPSVKYTFIALVLLGIVIRLLVTILGGGQLRTPWGGGGDSPTYFLLAQNLLAGKGFAYAGMPTALRPPGYPLLLAAFIKMFGVHALAAMRWLQFLEGLAVAFLCGAMAKRIWSERAGRFALLVALFFPTLVEMNGEILTEATATFLTALFLYWMVCYMKRPDWLSLVGFSCAIGLGALFRFNMAVLGFVALAVVLSQANDALRWRRVALVVILPLLVISPWLVRNLYVFHGQVLYSTHSGLDALEGVLTPQGRALPGDHERLVAAVGWEPPVDVETNNASRYKLADEPALNRQCWDAAFKLWRERNFSLVPLAVKKVADFWLSTDQLIWTAGFGLRVRIVRGGAVVVYWVLLALAVAGWFRLKSKDAHLARSFIFYAALVTVMHLPFVMSTRLRMPFMDVLLAVLVGIWAAGSYSAENVAEAGL